MSEALNDLRKLRKRVVEVAEGLNLEVGPFTVVPAVDELGVDRVRITFLMSPESVESAEETEKRVTDATFDEMMGNIGLSDEFLTGEEKAEKEAEGDPLEDAREAFKKRFRSDG